MAGLRRDQHAVKYSIDAWVPGAEAAGHPAVEASVTETLPP